MRLLFKIIFVKLFSLTGIFPVIKTDAAEIKTLLKKLFPIKCDKDLIRLGPEGDGGYLLPNDLIGIDAVFSPGVSNISGFENDCANMGFKVFLADKSVEKPAEFHELFNFKKIYLGSISNNDYITLEQWVNASVKEKNTDLLLQMDIEGYEYEVFLSASDKIINRFRIIIVEFHFLDQLWNKPFFNMFSSVFDKILQSHRCVHIHPNNCRFPIKINGIEIPPVMEFTFIRKDRIHNISQANSFPHHLDFDNTKKRSLILPKCWYSEE